MSERLIEAVRSKYASVATSGLSGAAAGVRAVAEAFGYAPEELASIPAEANMGLSCGNPTATARLKPGEVVVDLGSGGGLDVFLAARKVGPAGKAIGIDMTPEMIDLARTNAERSGLSNVEFHQAPIDRLPLPDASVDCVISNCVINLAPDKPAVFREIARVLKPGGRLAVSDIALKRPLPPELGDDLMAYVGCIAGAIPIDEYRRSLMEAGFAHVEVIDSGADLNAYAKAENQSGCCTPAAAPTPQAAVSACCAPTAAGAPEGGSGCCTPAPKSDGDDALHARLAALLCRHDVNDYAASVKVFAVKPG
jgi:arsenite methyltransferase